MHKLFLSLVLVLAQSLAGPTKTAGPTNMVWGASAAAPLVVQAQSCTAATNTCNITFSPAIVAGHRILVWDGSNTNSALPTMTGETFSLSTGANACGGSSSSNFYCYLDSSAVGGQTALACNSVGGASSITCAAVEVDAPQGLSPADAGGQTPFGGATTAFTVSTAGSTTHSTDLNLACFYEAGTFGTTIAVAGGYTSVVTAQFNGGSSYMLVEKLATSSTGIQTATATASGSVSYQAGIISVSP